MHSSPTPPPTAVANLYAVRTSDTVRWCALSLRVGKRPTTRSPPRWVAGDEVALRLAYEQFGTLIFTFCSRALVDRGAAADCTQETFLERVAVAR